jgi:hypothetical protein
MTHQSRVSVNEHTASTRLRKRVLLLRQLRAAFPSMLMDEVIAYQLVWPC